jgi:hypothetical protein
VDYSTQQSAAISTSTQIYTQGSVGTQYNSDEYFMKDAQVVRLADMKKMNEVVSHIGLTFLLGHVHIQ